jgi:hypothetical protein
MSRRGGRKRGRSRGLGRVLLFVGAALLLVGGLSLGAHFLDDEGEVPTPVTLEREVHVEPPSTWNRIRVEVLNGSGVSGLAARARDQLRAEGFDVVYYGNAASFDHATTRVLARTDGGPAARAVAGRLGVTGVEVEPDSTLFVDVTVILGADWTGLEDLDVPEDPGEQSGETTDWWDIRRLLVW